MVLSSPGGRVGAEKVGVETGPRGAGLELDAMMAIYAPDAREMLPDMPALVGRKAIRKFYEGLLKELPRFRHRFEAESALVSASLDLAVMRGAYRFTPDTDDPGRALEGKYVGVWRRLEGGWRLAINISNGDEPTGG